MQSRQGPALALWKRPVCKLEVPPLQGGEHQTVGQVRHPDLRSAFISEFEAWFLKTKQASKKWRGAKKLSDTAAPHLITLTNPILTKAVLRRVKDMLALALGWDKVTCQQLKSMLESCASPDQALRLLLRNSRSHPVHVGKEAEAKQGRQGRAATAGEASDGDNNGDSGPESSAADPDWEQQHSWLALPRDLPVQGVKVGVVPDSDPRVPLRGQRGIWAAQNLPEGYLIGPYRHYALYNRTYTTILSTPPRNWTGTPSSWKLQLDSYAANDDTGEMGTLDSATGKYGLTFSGFGYGNATAYANDPHLNPIEALAKPDMPDDYLGPLITGPDGQDLQGTVTIVFAKICGWAYGFMITHSPVKKGIEVLYDYGHSYWAFAAERISECTRDEELQRKLEDLRAQLRAATENTSGLTISINPSSSVNPATTQATSGAAAVAAAAKRLAAPKKGLAAAAAPPATSVGGSCAPAAAAAAGAGAAGSIGAGVSDVRQQMGGMQLAQGRGSSGGGDSATLGASVVRQQQQQPGVAPGSLVERTAEAAVNPAGALSAVTGSAAASDGRTSPGDEQDDACSAMPLSVLSNAVVFTPEQQLVLHQRQQRQQEQQRMTKVKDQQGNVQTVRRIDEPDVQQMVSDTRMMLSEELLKYPNGIRYSKLKPTWWNRYKAVQECFGDRWCFITSNSECFQMSQEVYSPNTRIELTPEWREALIAQLKAEDRLPMCVLEAEQAGAGGVQQHYSSNKRRRGDTREIVRVLRDDAAERELQKQLRDSEGEVAQLRQDISALLQLVQAARITVSQSLLQRYQQQQQHHHQQQQGPAIGMGAGGDSSRQQQHERGSSRDMPSSRDRQQQQQQQQSSRHRHGEPGGRNSRSPGRDWQAEGYTQHFGSSSGRHGPQGDRTQARVRSRSPNCSRGGQRDRSRSAGLGTGSRDRAADNQRPEQLGGYTTSANGYGAPAAAAAGGGPSASLDPNLFDLRSAPVFAGLASESDSDGRSVSPEAEAPAEPLENEDGEWNDVGVGRAAASRGGAHQSRGRGSNGQQRGNQQQQYPQQHEQHQQYPQQQRSPAPPPPRQQGMAGDRHDSSYASRQGGGAGYQGHSDSRQAGRGGSGGYATHPTGAHGRQNASYGYGRR